MRLNYAKLNRNEQTIIIFQLVNL